MKKSNKDFIAGIVVGGGLVFSVFMFYFAFTMK